MHYGTVVQFFPAKGFGFIRADFGPDVFFHISAVGACEEHSPIEVGQMVKYELMPAAEAKAPDRPKPLAKSGTKPAETARPQARMVERVDQLPEGGEELPQKPQSAHHPRARQKKPTWRR